MYIGGALPTVRVPKAPPRPVSNQAWETALSKADRRTGLLAAEAGLCRAEVALAHSNDLMDVRAPPAAGPRQGRQ